MVANNARLYVGDLTKFDSRRDLVFLTSNPQYQDGQVQQHGVSLLIISGDTYLNLTTFPRRLNVRSGHPQDDEWPAEKLWMEVLEGARVGVTEEKEAEDCLSSEPEHGTSRDISL